MNVVPSDVQSFRDEVLDSDIFVQGRVGANNEGCETMIQGSPKNKS